MLLPVGMIGCDGRTLTVRLFSDVPFDRVRRIHADSDSRTSIVLARVLLERLHGVRPEVVRFDAREGVAEKAEEMSDLWPETLLLIGDKVVTSHPPPGRYPHQMDLGEAWRSLTGLPFVYAAWACRASEVDSPRIWEIASVLDRARRRNAMRLGWLASRRAPEHRWPTPLAREYLTRLLRYEVDERAREGAERFLVEASDLGLIELATVRWHEPLTTCPA
jgi:predicted solute-binding protein